MAIRNDSTPDYLRGVRRLLIGVAAVLLLALFLIWRIDNARVEQLRVSLVDRFVPSFAWTVKPVAATARMIADLRAYRRVYEQNEELRRELQRMQGWREAALQLEQKNAKLLALNRVRLNPRMTFVTGEVMADAGSPFRRSGMVNVGRIDGVDRRRGGDGRARAGRPHRRRRRAFGADHLPQRRLEPGAGDRAPIRPAGAGHRRQRPGAGARVHRPARRGAAGRPGGELGRRRPLPARRADRPGRGRTRRPPAGPARRPTSAASTSCASCASRRPRRSKGRAA